MDSTLFIGFFAAFFTTFAFAPQSLKILKTRNTEGISIIMYIMFLTGVVSWMTYGILKSDAALFAANVITLLLAAPVLVVTLRARVRKS